jgi:uncharacterized Tic20 family protein
MGDLSMSSNPPPDSPQPTPPAAPAEAGVPSESKQEDKTMAMLCHLLGILTGFIGPLIIWLIKKDQSAFVNDQGKEALNFQITIAIAHFVAGLTCFITFGVLNGVIWVLALVFGIMGSMAANRGEKYRYPIALRLIK